MLRIASHALDTMSIDVLGQPVDQGCCSVHCSIEKVQPK